MQDHITFIHGSADELDTILGQQQFDHILSIDSAYHYNTRWKFLQSAHRHLNPDGSVGLFDLALHPQLAQKMTPINEWLLAALCSIVGIPRANLIVADEYRKHMSILGYTEVVVDCIDQERVFNGLSRAIKRQRERCDTFGIGTSFAERCFMHISYWMFHQLASHSWLVPVIVTAKKPLE
ncbi:hypothetical protein EC973_007347 [Apophysomyces ossiformis]|uniref:Methyltransferase type 11 domain-containing protein n=1 Tax=Apophysomyces ossiformis TaxID=679940 RepID=A0A8H7EQG7_9FUNG|nr:hypothetical protein EC973_007347 [Apophysomyces ossiformis]